MISVLPGSRRWSRLACATITFVAGAMGVAFVVHGLTASPEELLGDPWPSFNVAAGVVLSSAALFLVLFECAGIGIWLGGVVGLLGLGTLAQYAFGVNFGIDELFVDAPDTTLYPGRMGPNTAACLCLLGLSASAFPQLRRRDRRTTLWSLSAGLIGAISIVALLGHAVDLESAYGRGMVPRMAPLAATSLLLLAAGQVLLAFHQNPAFAIRSAPMALPLVVAIATVLLWQSVNHEERRHLQTTLELEGRLFRGRLESAFEREVQRSQDFASRWTGLGDTSVGEFEAAAADRLTGGSGVLSLLWLNEQDQVRTAVGAKLDIGSSLLAAVERARDRGACVLSKTRGPRVGEPAAALIVPATRSRESLVVLLDLETWLARSIQIETSRTRFELDFEGESLGHWGSEESDDSAVDLRTMALLGGLWSIETRPALELQSEHRSLLTTTTLLGGLLAAGLLALVTRQAQASRHNLQRAVRSKKRLEVEVSERAKIEQEVQRHARLLEQSNRELERFTYIASHDLQEPLRSITGFCQLLDRRSEGTLPPELREYLGFIVEASERMKNLIQDLLVYSRTRNEGTVMQMVDCNLICQAVVVDLQTALDESEAKVKTGTLPTLVADPIRVRQLFQNLLGNAVKFRDTERPLVIEVNATEEGIDWHFTISDTGIGFESEYADEVFQPFRRLHARGRFPGTGIGLSICKQVVERLGGRIWVETAVGEGSTFHFLLPTRAHDPGSSSPEPSPGK